MRKYVFLILLFSVLISAKSKAQASLGVSQYAYTVYNDTVSAYTFDSVSIFVVNKGTATFNDNFQVLTSVQDSAASTYHGVDTAYAFGVIPPGDSVNFMLLPYYCIDTSCYHYDINVIVIWPVALTASTADSLIFNVVILLPVSVQEIDVAKMIKAYPNPAANNIILENTGKNRVEEVRISDAQGRWISTTRDQDTINVESWKPGVYILSILLEDKRTITLRVVKQ